MTSDPALNSRQPWFRKRTSVENDRQALANLISQDADPAEVAYFEALSDPQVRLIDKAQRRRHGQYRRQLRRRTLRIKRGP